MKKGQRFWIVEREGNLFATEGPQAEAAKEQLSRAKSIRPEPGALVRANCEGGAGPVARAPPLFLAVPEAVVARVLTEGYHAHLRPGAPCSRTAAAAAALAAAAATRNQSVTTPPTSSRLFPGGGAGGGSDFASLPLNTFAVLRILASKLPEDVEIALRRDGGVLLKTPYLPPCCLERVWPGECAAAEDSVAAAVSSKGIRRSSQLNGGAGPRHSSRIAIAARFSSGGGGGGVLPSSARRPAARVSVAGMVA